MCKKEYGEPRERPDDDLGYELGDDRINYQSYSGANDYDRWLVLAQPAGAAGNSPVDTEPISYDGYNFDITVVDNDAMDAITLARTITGLYRDGFNPDRILFPDDSPVHLAAKWLWDHGPENRV